MGLKSVTNNEDAANVLCVPITVQAMMVGISPVPTVFANIPDDYSRIQFNPLGDLVPSSLMSAKSQEKPGVHLSWLLPEGLRQGIQPDETQEPEYPKVPNRWIVTRLWSSDQQPDCVIAKHWIVESDALEEECSPDFANEDSLTFPKLDDSKKPYRILGRSYPYEASVAEPAERLDDLNALGPGNPAFSIMYPYHRNVFGFYDNLTDQFGKRMENGSISYVVRGLYQDGYRLVESKEICSDRYGWQPPEGLTFPATLALHGVVTDLHWKNDGVDYNSPVIRDLKEPNLAVGNTTTEAIAAMYGEQGSSHERLMRVLLNDQSHKLLNLNGIYQSDYAEHDRRFQLVAEQHTYKLQSKINDQKHKDLAELPPATQIQFRHLQQGIHELHQLQFDVDAKRSAIYDLWCKYMTKSQSPFNNAEAKRWIAEYEKQLVEQIQALAAAESEIQAAKERLKVLEQQLGKAVQASFVLQQTSGHRFYEPNSPVLLLSNANRGTRLDSKLSKRILLTCRLLNETVQALQVDFTLRGSSHSAIIHASELLPVTEVKGNWPELLLEGTLFSMNYADLITNLIGQQLGLLPLSEEERTQITDLVHKMQRNRDIGRAESSERLPDLQFLQQWKPPWTPVLLSWRGQYYPDKALVSNQPKLSNWTLQGTDYVYTGSDVETVGAVTLEGKIYLTPHIAEQLHAMSVKQLGTELTHSLGSLDKLDYLSQALDGFNERFLMSKLALRFPVMVFQKGSAALANEVRNALQGFSIEQPVFNEFFSLLRGGFFKLEELRLIDTFGQFQRIPCQNYAIAEDLRQSKEPIGQYVMLPPRFMQPTRLAFNWIQARSQQWCDFNLPDSPICGWMMPNHTDQSLLIYDEAGLMLGSLIATAFEGDSVQWRDAPDVTNANSESYFGNGTGALPVGMNEDMKAFLNEMLRRSREDHEDVLSPFLQLVDSALWDIHQPDTASGSGLSLFVGKPLVLARAHVKLEQAGPPSSYKLLEKDTKKPSPVPDVSIKQFEMPVWIGEKQHTGDGTIGFFIQDGKSDYKQFNSAFANPNSDSNSYMKCNNQIDIAADDQSAGLTVSIIMDPLASIHLISGMLPVSEQRIPPDRVETALDRLYLTIYVGPLLVGEETYVMPLTKLSNRDWSFIMPGEAEAWIETQHVKPSNGNAFLAKSPFRAVEGWLKLKAGGSHESETP